MTDSQMICDRGMIEQFLNNTLSSQEAEEFEIHLESCFDCQSNLTRAAADENWWGEAQESLQVSDVEDPKDLAEVLSFLNPSENPRMMGRFGGYEIAGLIGQGGMGIVLKGLDESLNRFAAIKVLAPQLATRGSARSRFAREAQAAAAVVHDNVIAIHGVSEAAGLPFLVMPYVRGESLQKRLDRDGPMKPTEIVRVAHQVASGLAAANKQGLVHRDIKPANILLPEGVQRVLITDFGLARAVDDSQLTGTGTIAGTPQFMSPEQARGDAVDPRSDLFSLGTVIYAMCTGRSPFRASSPYGVLRRIVEDTPRSIREINSDIPVWLETIVCRLHAKQPEHRFQSASELAKLLEECLAHLQNPSVKLPQELRAVPLNPFPRALGLGLFACLVVLAGIVWFGGDLGMVTPFDDTENPKSIHQQMDETKLKPQQSDENLSPVQEKSSVEDLEFREHMHQLNLHLEKLKSEGNFQESLAVEKQILMELKAHDHDHRRLAELRAQVIDLRLNGDNQSADSITDQIKVVEHNFELRYRQLDVIDKIEELISERLAPFRKQINELQGLEKPDELSRVVQQANRALRKIESEYRNLSDPWGKSQEVERVNRLLDARISRFRAAAEVERRKSVLEHSEKLLSREFVTESQVESDKNELRIAELNLQKANNVLSQFGEQELLDSISKFDLSDLESLDGTNAADNLAQANLKIAELESKLLELNARFAKDHPKVREIEQQIEFWQQFSEKLGDDGSENHGDG